MSSSKENSQFVILNSNKASWKQLPFWFEVTKTTYVFRWILHVRNSLVCSGEQERWRKRAPDVSEVCDRHRGAFLECVCLYLRGVVTVILVKLECSDSNLTFHQLHLIAVYLNPNINKSLK